jgi:lipoprotein-anchoring transpeptidase ErfK/SrfK
MLASAWDVVSVFGCRKGYQAENRLETKLWAFGAANLQWDYGPLAERRGVGVYGSRAGEHRVRGTGIIELLVLSDIRRGKAAMTLLRLFLCIKFAILVLLAAPQAFAQGRDAGDQPGYVPNAEDEQLDPRWQKTMVFYRTTEAPGTIIVHTSERFLYVVQPGGRALRYGIGVGRDGFQWQGLLKISRKQEWPDWTPPEEMIQRQPYLPRWMAGGPGNPLGARALYLGGTVYRIHGTNQPQTIGTAVSSGCFRLTNPDVTDLYERIPVGTKVVVRQRPEV